MVMFSIAVKPLLKPSLNMEGSEPHMYGSAVEPIYAVNGASEHVLFYPNAPFTQPFGPSKPGLLRSSVHTPNPPEHDVPGTAAESGAWLPPRPGKRSEGLVTSTSRFRM